MPRYTIKNLTDTELLDFEKHNQENYEQLKKEMGTGEADLETEAEYIANMLTHQKIIKEWNRRGVGLSPGKKILKRKKKTE